MICGAGTAVPCGRSACDHTPTALGGGEPMGALASSAGAEPFAEWSYVENWLAYNWSVPVSGGAGCEVLRRRERPFLLFDDDGRVRPILYPVSSQSQNQSYHYHATFVSITMHECALAFRCTSTRRRRRPTPRCTPTPTCSRSSCRRALEGRRAGEAERRDEEQLSRGSVLQKTPGASLSMSFRPNPL